jgi:hypothetical protein
MEGCTVGGKDGRTDGRWLDERRCLDRPKAGRQMIINDDAKT